MDLIRKIIKIFLKIIDFLLDLIFPKFCVGCKEEGIWLCKKCTDEIVLIKRQLCPICKRLSDQGKVCLRCKSKSNLAGVLVCAHYKDGPLKEAVHTFKYDFISSLAKPLSDLMVICLKENNFKKDIVIIPVPLHTFRIWQRGFNQSHLLSKEISNKLDYSINTDLKRVKNTKNSQASLSKSERIKNISNSFDYFGEKLIGKTVLLVDDVYTTGSTIEECAKVLKTKAKAKFIYAIVLARG